MNEAAPFITAGASLLTLLVTVGLTLILAFRRESMSAKDQANERRMVALENLATSQRALIDTQAAAHAAEVRTLRDNLHNDEKETIRLQGAVNGLQAQHSGLERDLSEIKDRMVSRDEYEQGQAAIHKRFDDLRDQLAKKGSPFGSGGYSQVRTGERPPSTSSPPPPRPR